MAARLVMLAVVGVLIGACVSDEATPPGHCSGSAVPPMAGDGETAAAPPADAALPLMVDPHQGPTAAELLASHVMELARMPALVSGGVIEISWRDADGRHFEQGDLDLRYRAPNELSIRLGKMGETLFLGGCNESRWWWYEGWTRPTRLIVGARDGARRITASDGADRANAGDAPGDSGASGAAEASGTSGTSGGAGASAASGAAGASGASGGVDARVPLTMEELLTLLGLRPVALGDPAPAPPRNEAGRWVVTIEPERSRLGVPTRVIFDRSRVQGDAGWSLVGIEALDPDGAVLLRSTMDAHRRVERRDRAPGDWPRLATRIRVHAPPRGDRGAVDWLVELDRPSASTERITPRLFDVDAVRASLRPQVVDDPTVSGAAE